MGILEKIFIKPDYTLEKMRTVYGVLCGGLGIFLNILLFLGKVIIGTISGSIAITADALNNLSDAGASVVTLVGFKLAAQKPDPNHPYGHGRIEYISGFIVSMLIIIMAVELIRSSFVKIFNPLISKTSGYMFLILIISILVKFYMAFYNRRVGKKINSSSLLATSMDSLSDCVATMIVLIVSILGRYGYGYLDGYAGVLVGIFILYAGYSAAKDTINPLLGQPPEEEFVNKIIDIVTHFDRNIVGMHDVMVHDYGPGRRIVSLHAEVPVDGNIIELHDIIDRIENKLNKELGCISVIHMDPVITSDAEVLELRDTIKDIVARIESSITIHDFRVVKGMTHTNLIFDVLVPYYMNASEEALSEQIQEAVNKEIGEKYFIVIHMDTDFTKSKK
ncbi:cation diffusion facilitator family transporter [Lachnobacterium bovis]|uniref:cation diffusion facilitator family transporter n=1 Tax=Lachnobacterium bovis TaxID=140626 RepID=UPI0003B7A645|nr:cation diffusion facilitator family transporter [Lachnobacterium bovis]